MSAPLPPRCHLCRARDEVAEDPVTGLWWCLDVPGCNFRARLRIHVRRAEALRLLEAERAAELEEEW